jgi:pyruvate dehydrogenase E1 component
MQYMRERRKALGGYVPDAQRPRRAAHEPRRAALRGVLQGHRGRKASTTMVFVRMLSKLLRDKEIGKLIVPIVPDEARTFGMESLFRAVGIYSTSASSTSRSTWTRCSTTRKAKDGQILEEGITEAGSMSSFIAAGTAYATHGVNTIPFFIFYSMFGFQRVGDLIWAGGRHARPRLPARRHRRPHDAGRRRAAAPGRPQPRVLAVGAEPASPTTRPTPTSWR